MLINSRKSQICLFLQILLVVGGQAPKAIRSVEAYDLKQEKWLTLSEMPIKRCRWVFVTEIGDTFENECGLR